MTQATTAQMEEWIQLKTFGRVHRLTVESSGDSLIIRGCTSTYHAKQLALHAAMDLCDPALVDVDIRVCMGIHAPHVFRRSVGANDAYSQPSHQDA